MGQYWLFLDIHYLLVKLFLPEGLFRVLVDKKHEINVSINHKTPPAPTEMIVPD